MFYINEREELTIYLSKFTSLIHEFSYQNRNHVAVYGNICETNINNFDDEPIAMKKWIS